MNHAPERPLNDDEADRTTGATDIDPPSTEPRERLEAAFAKLPPFSQSVFLAHRLDDLSYAEIATITGVSVRRIEREIARAIVAIDRALAERPRRRKWWRGR
jgi:RNA polymerase sigma factor (sigma-70 family)